MPTYLLKSIRNLLLFLTVIVVLYAMKSLGKIMLPLVVAIMFILLYEPIYTKMHKNKIPLLLITPILAVSTIVILVFVINIFVDAAQTIFADREVLGELLYDKILSILTYFNSVVPFDLDEDLLESWIERLVSSSSISSFAGSSFSALSSFSSSFFMFTLYFLILLFSMPGYNKYIKYIAGSDKRFLLTSKHIQKSIGSYMTVKFIVSLITGLIALSACSIFGVKYAVFWGFMTFLLNFIPTIGSIIATTLPALMAIVQFDSPFRIILFILILFGVQISIGQVIEPRIMGNRLSLNTVTIIFGLVFWSFIWGIPGAFLSVPLLVILKIFLQNNESFVFMSRIMGQPEK
ncbi:MAG: AI-2E family transporter [Spirochaetaceae bacterium]